MHMSDKAVTTLKQTHSGLCQGQPPFLPKLWTFNVSLKAAPMFHTLSDLKAVLCNPPRGWSRAMWGKRQRGGEGPAPMFTIAALLSFILRFGERFDSKKVSPGLKILKRKITDVSNSILLMKRVSAREVLSLAKKSYKSSWWQKWDKKSSLPPLLVFCQVSPNLFFFGHMIYLFIYF